MAAVALSIVQPANGSMYSRGETQVRLVGRVETLPPELAEVPLYYRVRR